MSTMETVSVQILDKEYQLASPPEQAQALREAASHLDKQMRTIRSGGRVIGTERIAVMAAINLSYELLQQRHNPPADAATEEKIQQLHNKLDDALNQYSQLQIG